MAAQQAFSNKYGVPTFSNERGMRGQISTVPVQGIKAGAPFVGLGAYVGETPQSLYESLNSAISKAISGGGQVGHTIFSGPASTVPGAPTGSTSPYPVVIDTPKSNLSLGLKDGFENIKNFIGPTGFLIGVALLGFMVLKK